MYVSGCEVILLYPLQCLVPHVMILLKNLVVRVLLKALGLAPHCHDLPVGILEKDA